MRIEQRTELAHPADAAWEALLSANYLEMLVARIDAIVEATEVERADEGGVITRAVRYGAPTREKIPSFLARYADAAPERVYWVQRERWDPAARSMRYAIEAEMKPEWRARYRAEGRVRLEPKGESACTMIASLELEVRVFGLGGLIERAVKKESSAIFAQQGEALRATLGS